MLRKFAGTALLCAATQLSYGADIHGMLQNNIYTNSSLGFSIKFPEVWHHLSATQEASIANAEKQYLTDPKQSDNALDFTRQASIPLFNVSEHPGDANNSGIIAKVFPLNAADKSIPDVNEQLLQQTKFALLKISAIKPSVSPIFTAQLGGLKFAGMNIKFKMNNQILNENMYAATRNDYLLIFVTTSHTPEQETIIQNTFNTLLFY